MQILLIIIAILILGGGLVLIFSTKKSSLEDAPMPNMPAPGEPPPAQSLVQKTKPKSRKNDPRKKDKSESQALIASIPADRLHQVKVPKCFIGRKLIVTEIFDAHNKKKCNLVNLYGTPGVGKTTLAEHLCEKLTPRFPNAQIYVDFKQGRDHPLTSEDALREVVNIYRYNLPTPETPSRLSALYRVLLRDQKAILIFDNVRTADQVAPLLKASHCMIIVTSLEPLGIPGALTREVENLTSTETLELMNTLVPRAQFWVKEISQSCENLPLLLTIIARFLAKIHQMDPSIISTQLRDERKKLEDKGIKGIDAGVRTTLNVLFQSLPEKTTSVFLRMVAFPDTFDVASEEFICEDEDNDHLLKLATFGMVIEEKARERYRLHHLIRKHLKNYVGQSELSFTEMRHATNYMTLLYSLNEIRQSDEPVAKRVPLLFDQEWENFRTGFNWAESRAQKDNDGARLCSSYMEAGIEFWNLRLKPAERIRWLNSALAAAQRMEDSEAEVSHLIELGRTHNQIGEFEPAAGHLQKALEACTSREDHNSELDVLQELGAAMMGLNNLPKAIEMFEEQLAIAKTLNKTGLQAEILKNIGQAYKDKGDTEKAIEMFKQGLEITRSTGDSTLRGQNIKSLSDAYMDMGEFRPALEGYQEALESFQKSKNRKGEAEIFLNMGQAYLKTDDIQQATAHFEQAAGIFRSLNDVRQEGLTVVQMAETFRAQNKFKKATELYEKSILLFQRINDPENHLKVLEILSEMYKGAMDSVNVIDICDKQLVVIKKLGDKPKEAEILWKMSQTLDEFGQRPKAIQRAEEALKLISDPQAPLGQEIREKLKTWNP